jgi:hypothetical protein
VNKIVGIRLNDMNVQNKDYHSIKNKLISNNLRESTEFVKLIVCIVTYFLLDIFLVQFFFNIMVHQRLQVQFSENSEFAYRGGC